MGEIGIPRNEFLHELRLWELRAIIRGYRARSRAIWEASRLNAFFTMSAMTDLRKSGIHRDTDLVRFPWETRASEPSDQPTPEEVQRMRELIKEENARLEKERGKKRS